MDCDSFTSVVLPLWSNWLADQVHLCVLWERLEGADSRHVLQMLNYLLVRLISVLFYMLETDTARVEHATVLNPSNSCGFCKSGC